MSWIPVQNKNKYIYIQIHDLIWNKAVPLFIQNPKFTYKLNEMWTDQYKRNQSWHSLPWTKLIPSGTKTKQKGLSVEPTGWQSRLSLAATRPWGFCHQQPQEHFAFCRTTLCKWEALPRDISSPESPNTILPYKTKGPSFLISKAFYTDKVYSSQLLCILVKEPWGFPPTPPPFTCKVQFLVHFCRIFASKP